MPLSWSDNYNPITENVSEVAPEPVDDSPPTTTDTAPATTPSSSESPPTIVTTPQPPQKPKAKETGTCKAYTTSYTASQINYYGESKRWLIWYHYTSEQKYTIKIVVNTDCSYVFSKTASGRPISNWYSGRKPGNMKIRFWSVYYSKWEYVTQALIKWLINTRKI